MFSTNIIYSGLYELVLDPQTVANLQNVYRALFSAVPQVSSLPKEYEHAEVVRSHKKFPVFCGVSLS
jgi:hypothetical protein